jgi:elongation factor 1-alpha
MQLLAAYALGIKSVVVAVSQADDASCSFGQARFREIEEKMRLLLRKVPQSRRSRCAAAARVIALQVGFNPEHVVFVPVAAVFGDCILQRSPRISWCVRQLQAAARLTCATRRYEGPPLLSAMQSVRALHKYGEKPPRACVLYKMHVGGVGVVLVVRVLTGMLRTGMSLSLCLAQSSHEVCCKSSKLQKRCFLFCFTRRGL